LKFEVHHENRQIYIPNIFLPQELSYNGIGKKMLYLIFAVGDHYGYGAFLTMLTDSFKERMLKRNAWPTDVPDILQLTKETKFF